MKKCFLILIIILLISSCVTSNNRRGSLSGAFDAADEDSEEDRRVDNGFTFTPIEDDDDYYPDYDDPNDNRDTYIESEPIEVDFTYWGFEQQYSEIFMNDFYRSLGTDIIFGSTTDGFGIFLKAGINWTAIRESKTIYEQLNGGLLGFNAGLDLRKNITDINKNIYVDLLLDTNIALLPWNYNNTVTSVVYDEFGNSREDKITFDSISTFSMGAGLGFCFWDQKSIALFLDPTIGFNLFYPYTAQGFDNDVFKPYGYFKLMLKLLFVEKSAESEH